MSRGRKYGMNNIMRNPQVRVGHKTSRTTGKWNLRLIEKVIMSQNQLIPRITGEERHEVVPQILCQAGFVMGNEWSKYILNPAVVALII